MSNIFDDYDAKVAVWGNMLRERDESLKEKDRIINSLTEQIKTSKTELSQLKNNKND